MRADVVGQVGVGRSVPSAWVGNAPSQKANTCLPVYTEPVMCASCHDRASRTTDFRDRLRRPPCASHQRTRCHTLERVQVVPEALRWGIRGERWNGSLAASATTAERPLDPRPRAPKHGRRKGTGRDDASTTDAASRRGVRGWLPDALALLWVLLVAWAGLTPALVHGWSLGNYAVQTIYGGLASTGAKVHYTQASDQLTLFMPLTNLAWTQVHQGHLPLWNPYNALGLPLAFNWESATFSVPNLIGYVVPLHLAYTVQVLVTYAIAGSGVYVLGRVLRLGVLGSVMAATVYEIRAVPSSAWWDGRSAG